MAKRLLTILFMAMAVLPAAAQKNQKARVASALRTFFANYRVDGYQPTDPMGMNGFQLDAGAKRLTVVVNDAFASQPFTTQSAGQVYTDMREILPGSVKAYTLRVENKRGRDIRQLVPNYLRGENADKTCLWGKIEYEGAPWVANVSRPFVPDRGLEGRHLSLWASHGHYFNGTVWKWQRPNLFCTREDLFTQTIVVPYLIPMLERAGAVVFTPRERDWQTHEVVIDNDADTPDGTYSETQAEGIAWETGGVPGFAPVKRHWKNGENPFRQGTVRLAEASSRQSHRVAASWSPRLPKEGRYAVYVSYATLPNSIPDAHYIVRHRGGETHFRVNQRMGGSTWVYLGTFDFDTGDRNGVVLTNESGQRGVVTADGVRFGGGMGNIARDGETSGMPRHLEGARYAAQWGGMPTGIYNNRDNGDDYAEDINTRSLATNYLAGGSPYLPGHEGLNVPVELSLAVHSDAGVRRPDGIYGSLAICTTSGNDDRTRFCSNVSRETSFDLADMLLASVCKELGSTLGRTWTRRELWNRNYSETRNPEIPSAIIETLSHQNFTDMVYGHDPNFKFVLARAIYKAVLRYVHYMHGSDEYVVQPLPVKEFAATFTDDETHARLSWLPTPDTTDADAFPTGYIVYTRAGDGAFDNGTYVKATTVDVPIEEGVQYSFRVSAVNRGGESFPSETLTVCKMPGSLRTVLIVNGFQRVSSPTVVDTPERRGFDMDDDIGLAHGSTTGFCGAQINFSPSAAGQEGPEALGYSGDEWEGRTIAGNTFDYPVAHGQSIFETRRHSFVSCSRDAVYKGTVDLNDYPLVDLILGAERATDYGLVRYKTFDARLRGLLTRYCEGGGRLFVSGAYIASDMLSQTEQDFTRQLLKYQYAGTVRTDTSGIVQGLNLTIPIYRTPCAEHYAVQAPDCLYPAGDAFCAFAYGNGHPAGTAYRGSDYRVLAMGFPFECIRDAGLRHKAMGAILRFLLDE